MRLCTYEVDGRRTFGAVVGGDVIDLATELAQREELQLPDLRRFIAFGHGAMELAHAIVSDASTPRRPLDGVRLLAPIDNPRKMLCIGLNYRDHCEEGGVEPPKNPIWFPKFANTIQRPGGPIELPPRYADNVDYEGELAVIIGRRCRDVSEDAALDYVFGYTICHDVSARDVQFSDGQWGRGKSFDTFAPLGPAIVTGDELGDPNNLSIKTQVNNEVLQDSNTSRMIFNVPFLISFLSHCFTFEPGDLISTGTPFGVGAFRDPKIFLKPGDTVRIEIEKIGVLENPVVAAAPRP